MPEDIKLTLKTARELAGYTQLNAAKELGISVETLYNWEKGRSFPSVPAITKIEDLYGINYNQIIFLPINYGKTVISKNNK